MAAGIENWRACLLLYGLADISFSLSDNAKVPKREKFNRVGTHVDAPR